VHEKHDDNPLDFFGANMHAPFAQTHPSSLNIFRTAEGTLEWRRPFKDLYFKWYPLVNTPKTMENHIFYGVNQRTFYGHFQAPDTGNGSAQDHGTSPATLLLPCRWREIGWWKELVMVTVSLCVVPLGSKVPIFHRDIRNWRVISTLFQDEIWKDDTGSSC
jgi:hypothetical protein